MTTAIFTVLALWAAAASYGWVREHLRAEAAITQLYVSDQRNARLRRSALGAPVPQGFRRRAVPSREPAPRRPALDAARQRRYAADPLAPFAGRDPRQVVVPRWSEDPVPTYMRRVS